MSGTHPQKPEGQKEVSLPFGGKGWEALYYEKEFEFHRRCHRRYHSNGRNRGDGRDKVGGEQGIYGDM